MGLDMYAFVTRNAPSKEVDFDEPSTLEEIHYWRKHPNLHGWMEQLYRRKGGQNPDFNVAPVVLNDGDIDRLEQDIRRNQLPYTDGFFFGASDGTEVAGDLDFIANARAAIALGMTVFYIADW